MDSILAWLNDFQISSLFSNLQVADWFDILGVAILIYFLFKWIRQTRGWVLFRGILLVGAVWFVAYFFNLKMVSWIFQSAFSVGLLAIIIIFQPELRRALERLGTNYWFRNMLNNNEVNDRTAEAITRAMASMASVKTGALIVVEQQVALGEYEQTGIPIDSEVSSQLLINIFEKNTPLHDGAVIIRQNRILAATCYLPLSDNSDISKELGTRHRAAIGLSEVSDAKIFVVSEETGAMSMAQGGEIHVDVDSEFIKRELLRGSRENGADGEEKKLSFFQRLKNFFSGKEDEE